MVLRQALPTHLGLHPSLSGFPIWARLPPAFFEMREYGVLSTQVDLGYLGYLGPEGLFGSAESDCKCAPFGSSSTVLNDREMTGKMGRKEGCLRWWDGSKALDCNRRKRKSESQNGRNAQGSPADWEGRTNTSTESKSHYPTTLLRLWCLFTPLGTIPDFLTWTHHLIVNL